MRGHGEIFKLLPISRDFPAMKLITGGNTPQSKAIIPKFLHFAWEVQAAFLYRASGNKDTATIYNWYKILNAICGIPIHKPGIS